ncbi:hypothetical protein TSUD_166300 [Trifolium subterraneum]|uniref:CCHC-type domain-containing protein n=1 Tax=Trifolium subterraneum TaxID=3900 RepID=A0A2Z6MUZ1_TRISU|nr:hypothetical protein TSUD_166300 [Trifolium subterraneum]
MEETTTFIQPSIPKFDGHYDHWAMLKENLLRSKELWSSIEARVTPASANATAKQQRIAQENQLKDLKVKRAQLQALQREFEVLAMGESETVNDYFARTLAIANRMTTHGETMEQVTVVEKILRSMTKRFKYVVCYIEQSTDVTTMSIDELQSSFLVQEGRMKSQKQSTVEQALKMAGAGRGNGRGRGRTSIHGRGRGRTNKDLVQCYKCHKFGHYQNECPEWENANYCEIDEEEMLLMDDTGSKYNTTKEEMAVMGKGNVKMNIGGKLHVITDVYYIPGLSSNLLSVGQLQQRNLTIVFKHDVCQIVHNEKVWRASHKLELVHSDICGPINRTSNGGNSSQGIKRQLTTAYTPQQNGVSERKNRTILNMVRSMISARNVPKRFWPEAVNWATYVMNRSPTHVVQDVTPEEAWSGYVSNSSDSDELTPRTRRPSSYLRVTNQEQENETDAMQNLALLSFKEDPDSYEEAVKHEVWKKAMESEIEAIKKNDTWELTDLPQGVKPIGVKWIYKTKYNKDGNIDKHKAKLVAKGYAQKHGVDYSEVFAPVARWDTIRAILSLAALNDWCVFQLDVQSAFLHGELSEDVYVNQPLGFQTNNQKLVYKLKKALYGLKQAPRAWYSKIESYFIKEQFTKCPHEHTLFVKNGEEDKILIVSLYVDDVIYTVSQSPQDIFIRQHKYAYEILKRFGMEECNNVSSPIVPGFAWYMDRPTEMHVAAVKRILRYLKGTMSYRILYRNIKEGKVTLVGWTDSDYAGDYDDRKITSGYVFTMGTGAISWSSKKQPILLYLPQRQSLYLLHHVPVKAYG